MNADELNKNLSIKQIDQDQTTWHDLLQQLPKTEVPAEIDQTILQAAAQQLDSKKHTTISPRQPQATYTLWQRWTAILKKPWFNSLFAGGLAASVATVVWLKQPDPLAGLPKAESAKTTTTTMPVIPQKNEAAAASTPSAPPAAAGIPVDAAKPAEQNTARSIPAQEASAARADKTDKVTQSTQSNSNTNTSKTQTSNKTQTSKSELETTPNQDAKPPTNQISDASDVNKQKSATQQQQIRKAQEKKELVAETSISNASKDISEEKTKSKGMASPQNVPSPAPVAASSAAPESTAADPKRETARSPVQTGGLDANKQSANAPKMPSSRSFRKEDKTINASTPTETEKTPGLSSNETSRSKEYNSETNIITKKQHVQQCFHDIETQIKNETNEPAKIKANLAACQRAHPNTRLSSTIQQFLTENP